MANFIKAWFKSQVVIDNPGTVEMQGVHPDQYIMDGRQARYDVALVLVPATEMLAASLVLLLLTRMFRSVSWHPFPAAQRKAALIRFVAIPSFLFQGFT